MKDQLQTSSIWNRFFKILNRVCYIPYSLIEQVQASLQVLSETFEVSACCGKDDEVVPFPVHHSTINLLVLNFLMFLCFLKF